ncbi:MAG TPA: relaxase/mobilization nuclease domain-containing protein [Thermoanaerobaculia bacterium]|nr:relaxase/mobilization nuclease domain-containing protein [Thermoanaerobaculia bacterium]
MLTTNLFGATPREFLRQIDDVGRLRAKAPAAPVVHLTLRAAGGEDLSDQQWSSAVDYVLQELGYDNSPFMAYLHAHEGGRHLHIATYRVRFDGRLVSDSMDRYRIMAVCRELERRFSLTIATPGRNRHLTRPALEKAVKQPDREVRLAAVRRAISEAAAESFTLRELVTRLYTMGITTHLKVARNTGKLQGVSFELPISREIIRGSTLGKQFSLANLCNAHNLAVDHAASGPVLVMHGLTNLELRRLRQSLPPDRVVSEGSRQNAYWVLPASASDFADLVVTRMPHRFVTFAGLDPYLHPTQELLESRQQLALTVRRQLEHPSPTASIADGAPPALESMLASLVRQPGGCREPPERRKLLIVGRKIGRDAGI